MIDPKNQGTFLTTEGKQKAEEELNYLKNTKRKQIAERIHVAKEMGDLSENAEYATAKDDQAFTESRILELENLLRYAQVIIGGNNNKEVGIGSTVTVIGEDKKEKVYIIVGFNEANPAEGKVTNESPVGQALIGHQVGDVVTVATPKGEKELKIIVIS